MHSNLLTQSAMLQVS